MLIQPTGFVHSPGWRPQAAPVASVGSTLPADTARISTFTPPLHQAIPLNLAAQAVSAAAQATPAPAAARPALQELRSAAERLQQKGVKIEHRPKVLFFTLDYRESTPDKAAKLSDTAGRVRVQRTNFGQPISLARSEDLLLLDAFYGKGDVSELERPQQAAALLALEKAYPGKVDAYHSYLRQELSATLGKQVVLNLDEALALAYVEGHVASPEGLQRPEQAECLHRLERAGFTFPGTTLDAYRNVGYRHSKTAVHQDGQILAEFDGARLADIPRALEETHEMSRVWRQLSSALGEHAPAALQSVRGEAAQRFDLKTRTELARSVFAQPEHAPYVYDAACYNAANAGDLDAWVALARQFIPLANVIDLPFTLGRLKTLAPEGQLPTKETIKQFQTFLKVTRSAEHAAQCLKALAAHPDQPESPERFFPPLLQACPNQNPQFAAQAFQVLAEAGRLEQDHGLLADMLSSTRHADTAISAYPVMTASVPEPQREAYLKLWKQAPGCSMQAAWQAVHRSDEQLTSVRTRAWSRGVKLMLELQHPREIDRFSQLLGSLPDGPDLAQRTELLERVVRGSKGSMSVVEKVWKDFQNSSDIDTAARLYEATGRQDEASRAAEILTRTDLVGSRSYEACRDSLALLIEALGGKVDDGLAAYRHLLAVGGDDLLATARDYASLIEVCGQEPRARVALGACRTSPPVPGSPTTAQTLALALEVHGDLAQARPLWESLELSDQKYPREERIKNVQAALASYRPEYVKQLLPVMEEARLDDRGRQITQKLRSARWPDTLQLVQLLGPGRPEREPLVMAYEKLSERCSNLPELVAALAPQALKADFGQVVEAVTRLGHRADRALVERLLAAHQPGEDLRPVADLLVHTGEGFDARRQALQEGTVEGKGLERNTRWFVAAVNSSTLKMAEAAWEAVRHPVGSESTAERQAAFDRLCAGRVGESQLKAWQALTRWMQPGETLLEAAEAARAIRAKLVGKLDSDETWASLLQEVRQRQMSGELEHLTLARVVDRVEKAVTAASSDALLDSKKSSVTLQSLIKHLCEQVAGGQGIQTGEHHVVVGGVRVATR